jgi:hypothetical protein
MKPSKTGILDKHFAHPSDCVKKKSRADILLFQAIIKNLTNYGNVDRSGYQFSDNHHRLHTATYATLYGKEMSLMHSDIFHLFDIL